MTLYKQGLMKRQKRFQNQYTVCLFIFFFPLYWSAFSPSWLALFLFFSSAKLGRCTLQLLPLRITMRQVLKIQWNRNKRKSTEEISSEVSSECNDWKIRKREKLNLTRFKKKWEMDLGEHRATCSQHAHRQTHLRFSASNVSLSTDFTLRSLNEQPGLGPHSASELKLETQLFIRIKT